MRIITEDNIKTFLIDGGLKIKPIYPIEEFKHWELVEDIEIKLSTNHTITILKGFRFDGSSTPRFLWWALPSYGDFLFGAFLHDYLYDCKFYNKYYTRYEAQKMADKEMFHWSNVLNSKNWRKKLDNKIRYYGVRLFGKSSY